MSLRKNQKGYDPVSLFNRLDAETALIYDALSKTLSRYKGSSVTKSIYEADMEKAIAPLHRLYFDLIADELGYQEIFLVKADAEEVVQIYFNPDSNAGGQFVICVISYDLIKEAYEKAMQVEDADGMQETFFSYMEEMSTQYCADIGTASFVSTLQNFMAANAGERYLQTFTDLCAETMQSLIELVSGPMNFGIGLPKVRYCIGRPIEGITVNGLEYVLDNEGNLMTFASKVDAVRFLAARGIFYDEDSDIVIEEVRQ